MHCHHDHASALEPLRDDGWLHEILHEIKSGKEATVFCCRGGPRAGVPLVAAKVYRPIETRRFKNDARYVEGRLHVVRRGRACRAVESHSAFGRRVQYATWLAREWEVLHVLHAAGAAVPQPLACGDRAIVMPFLGRGTDAAPMLQQLQPDRAEAARILDELLWNVELMLDLHCVHADLSPFNVMVHEGRPIIIDFPQAVDPRLNHSAGPLLARDVDNLCRWAARHGVHRPAAQIAAGLWQRFVLGELG